MKYVIYRATGEGENATLDHVQTVLSKPMGEQLVRSMNDSRPIGSRAYRYELHEVHPTGLVESGLPEYLTVCCFHVCARKPEFSVEARHGKEYPCCPQHVTDALLNAYRADGDWGEVTVYHIDMHWVRRRRLLDDD